MSPLILSYCKSFLQDFPDYGRIWDISCQNAYLYGRDVSGCSQWRFLRSLFKVGQDPAAGVGVLRKSRPFLRYREVPGNRCFGHVPERGHAYFFDKTGCDPLFRKNTQKH